MYGTNVTTGVSEVSAQTITPAPRRGTVWLRLLSQWRAVVSIAVVLVVLEVVGLINPLGTTSIPLPSEVAAELLRLVVSPTFWVQVAQTLGQALAGLALGAVVAIPTGIVLGRLRPVEHAARPIIEFLRAIPSVAILPLVILTMGVGFGGATLLASISSFWLILVLTIRGARAVDPIARQALTVFGVPRAARLWRLILPSAAPFIVTGVRIAASVALIVAITAELLGGMPGLGKAVTVALQNGNNPAMYAYLVTAGILGVLINASIVPIENRLLSWHPSRRVVAS